MKCAARAASPPTMPAKLPPREREGPAPLRMLLSAASTGGSYAGTQSRAELSRRARSSHERWGAALGASAASPTSLGTYRRGDVSCSPVLKEPREAVVDGGGLLAVPANVHTHTQQLAGALAAHARGKCKQTTDQNAYSPENLHLVAVTCQQLPRYATSRCTANGRQTELWKGTRRQPRGTFLPRANKYDAWCVSSPTPPTPRAGP